MRRDIITEFRIDLPLEENFTGRHYTGPGSFLIFSARYTSN